LLLVQVSGNFITAFSLAISVPTYRKYRETNSVTTNPWLKRTKYSVPNDHFTAQNNLVIINPGCNEQIWSVPRCSLQRSLTVFYPVVNFDTIFSYSLIYSVKNWSPKIEKILRTSEFTVKLKPNAPERSACEWGCKWSQLNTFWKLNYFVDRFFPFNRSGLPGLKIKKG